MKLFTLQGLEFEEAYMTEVGFFTDAQKGVDDDQILAALLLRDAGQYETLGKLHRREIRVIGEVDEENAVLEDLGFEAI